ncbi:MAG: thioredoxin [Candidatus Marinimicrobia bacterium]|nr:thioredoxin [Candidatus Neomarinimicrobiota bacterium]
MAGKVIHTSDKTFEAEVLKSEIPVVVDFWAEWCMPCRMIAPALEEISAELDGKVIIAKLDVDNNPLTAGQYGVRSIPTLLIIKAGTVVNQIIGAVPKSVIKDKIKEIL